MRPVLSFNIIYGDPGTQGQKRDADLGSLAIARGLPIVSIVVQFWGYLLGSLI